MAQHTEHELTGGDRVRIQQGRHQIAHLIGRTGTILEVFRMPLDSCLVRIDGDPNLRREWFFYRDEFVVSNP